MKRNLRAFGRQAQKAQQQTDASDLWEVTTRALKQGLAQLFYDARTRPCGNWATIELWSKLRTFSLALRTEERGSLCLDDSFDLRVLASRAWFFQPAVNAVAMLIPTFSVEYVAIRTVRQRRTFVLDRLTKHIEHRGVNP